MPDKKYYPHPTADFGSFENGLLSSHFNDETIKTQAETFNHEDLRAGVGIELGYEANDSFTAWVMARYVSTERDNTIELNVLNPRHLHIGQTALVDTVLLVNGDAYTVGREKHPELYVTTSQTHAVFEASYGDDDQGKLELQVTNLGRNGTGIVRRTEEALLYDPEFAEFIQNNGEAITGLTDQELVRLYGAKKLIEVEFTHPSQRGRIFRAINRDFHPDTNRGREEQARNMLNLLNDELRRKEEVLQRLSDQRANRS